MPNSKIRRDAKNILKGNWLKVGLILGLFVIIVSAVSTVTKVNKFTDEICYRLVDFYNISPRQEQLKRKEFIAYSIGMIVQVFMTAGLCNILINLVQGKKYGVMMLFKNVKTGLKAVALGIVSSIFVALWFCLFIIPGIIKIYSYSMSLYVLAQNPEKSILECITESREMMNGNKFNLFCMKFYFKMRIIINLMLVYIPFFLVSFSGKWTDIFNILYIDVVKNTVGVILFVILLIDFYASLIYFCIYGTVSEATFYMVVSGQEYNKGEVQE